MRMGGKGSLGSIILDFDPQYQVFWVEVIPPIRYDSIHYAAEIGNSCYWGLKRMQEAKKTKWQFPCLSPNRKPITENPLPPQYLYEDIELDLRFWNEAEDISLFLDEFNLYYNNYEVEGQYTCLSSWYQEFNPDLGYGGALICQVHNSCCPISAGILFEFGVRMAHADDTNFWNLPVPPPEPMGSINPNDIADMTKQLNLYLGLPENYFERAKNIVRLRGLIFKRRMVEKIAAVKELITRRPLLVREKIELDFLAKIQAADNIETLKSIENEVNSTPTDPELIKQLLHHVSEKKGFY